MHRCQAQGDGLLEELGDLRLPSKSSTYVLRSAERIGTCAAEEAAGGGGFGTHG